jgi:phage gpG-like protein
LIEFHIDTASLKRQLDHILSKLEDLPQKRASKIRSIMESGIKKNFRTLSRGGSVVAAGGTFRFALAWPQVRHPATVAVRRERGLGGVFPILHGTGFLEEGLFGGTFNATGHGATYSPRSDVLPLIRLHQYGGPVLPGRKGRVNPAFRSVEVPPRPMVFWSQDMADAVLREGKSVLEGAL